MRETNNREKLHSEIDKYVNVIANLMSVSEDVAAKMLFQIIDFNSLPKKLVNYITDIIVEYKSREEQAE